MDTVVAPPLTAVVEAPEAEAEVVAVQPLGDQEFLVKVTLEVVTAALITAQVAAEQDQQVQVHLVVVLVMACSHQ